VVDMLRCLLVWHDKLSDWTTFQMSLGKALLTHNAALAGSTGRDGKSITWTAKRVIEVMRPLVTEMAVSV